MRATALSSLLVWVIVVSASSLPAQLRFRKDVLPTGLCPAHVLAPDLNEDGRPDLIVANHHTYDISIFLGAGGTSFTPRDPARAHEGEETHALAMDTGDFNEDGNLDLVTPSFHDDDTMLFLGDGAGGFSEHFHFPVGRFPLRVVARDFTGDGHLDAAVINRDDGTVSLLAGDGQAGFPDQTLFPVGKAPTAIASADLNGDHADDLVTADSAGKTVTILFGDGQGSFPESRTLSGFDTTSFPLLADFDADGRADLAVSNGHEVAVLRGEADGAFGEPLHYATDSTTLMMAAADLDDDGDLDLVTTDWTLDRVSVFPGDGAGRFGEPQHVPAGDGPWGVLAADLDEDGHVDLAVTNELENTLFLFWNRTSEAVPFVRSDANSDGGTDLSDAVQILAYLFLGTARPTCLAALDASGDGEILLNDAVYILIFLFSGGHPPPEPFPACGTSSGGLDCSEPTPACA